MYKSIRQNSVINRQLNDLVLSHIQTLLGNLGKLETERLVEPGKTPNLTAIGKFGQLQKYWKKAKTTLQECVPGKEQTGRQV